MAALYHGKCIILFEGNSKEEVSLAIWHLLGENNFLSGSRIGGVGLCQDEKTGFLIIVLPKVYNNQKTIDKLLKNSDYLKKTIYGFLKLLSFARRRGVCQVGHSDRIIRTGSLKESCDPLIESIEAAIEIRYDFLRNGVYKAPQKKSTRNQFGRPNWRRTLTSVTPNIVPDIFFPRIICDSLQSDNDNILTRLHCTVVEEIALNLGEKYEKSACKALSPEKIKDILKDLPRFLRSLRSNIYDDRGIYILALMSSYLKNKALQASNLKKPEPLLGICFHFEKIWEKIVENIFDIYEPLSKELQKKAINMGYGSIFGLE